MDWNDDGKKDLLTGECDGMIRIYLNTNTDAEPVFTGYEYLQLSGHDFDCGDYSMPCLADWNNDGLIDVLCGDSLGKIQLLVNEGTHGNPLFNEMVYLQDFYGDLDPGMRVSPAVADLNRDGKKDLIVGEYGGKIHYYENIGTDEEPSFFTWECLYADGTVIDVEHYSRISVVDWNNDGVIDILSGNRNFTGTPKCTVWLFECIGPLSLDYNVISASAGGEIHFHLDASATHEGRDYYILGSLSGTEPGTPLPGGIATLPLNWDPFTEIVLMLVNTPVFGQFAGTLDSNGQAMATLNTCGAIPQAAGLLMNYSYTLTSPFDFVSNGAYVEITN